MAELSARLAPDYFQVWTEQGVAARAIPERSSEQSSGHQRKQERRRTPPAPRVWRRSRWPGACSALVNAEGSMGKTEKRLNDAFVSVAAALLVTLIAGAASAGP